jgi:O-glycosyl hydrolase
MGTPLGLLRQRRARCAANLHPVERRHSLLVSGAWALALTLVSVAPAWAATVTIDTSLAARQQTIDGFGTCLAGDSGEQSWFQDLYYHDARFSILRIDMVPSFRSPYADFTYNSPWFHNNPPLPGADGNNVRTYTGPSDYGRLFAGRNAPIAVMTPNIDSNVGFFDYEQEKPRVSGAMAQLGRDNYAAKDDFKLIASLWSPMPWVKVSSGNTIGSAGFPLPVGGTRWPFIWGGNFSGGRLDTSNTPLAIFNDGTGPTSALTQFARATAAYLRGFQERFDVRLYAISIQNELNFETFYNSCSYPLSSQYIAALKRVRAELDLYPDLRDIKIMGPEDLLGGDAYGMWEYGGPVHKNLQYLRNAALDPVANAALAFFVIHGYAPDGISAPGATPQQWLWWRNGWSASPAAGIPANVAGFASYGRKSWMTETSGENPAWLAPATGFPSGGGFGVALRIHQALTAGQQSAYVYWQLADGGSVGDQTLTDDTLLASSPKYVALKHYARFVRPKSVRVESTVGGSTTLLASAYLRPRTGMLTIVLLNESASPQMVNLTLPPNTRLGRSYDMVTSSSVNLWQVAALPGSGSTSAFTMPGYSVVTIYRAAADESSK